MSDSPRPSSFARAALEVAKAATALVLADACVRLVPFGTIARRIERSLRRAASQETPDLAVRRVAWAIDAAHRRLPWNVRCLATALAANRLLARRGIASELWLGVRANEQTRFDAHAWLIAHGFIVTGRAEQSSYRPLRSFVTRGPV